MTTNNTNLKDAIARINATYSNNAQLVVGRELIAIKDSGIKGFYNWLADQCHDNVIRYGSTYCKNAMLVCSMVDSCGGKYASKLESVKFSSLYALASACRDDKTKTFAEADLKIMVKHVKVLDAMSEQVANEMGRRIKAGVSLADAIAACKDLTTANLKLLRRERKTVKASKDAENTARLKAEAVKPVYESIAAGNNAMIGQLTDLKSLIAAGNTADAITMIDDMIANLTAGRDSAIAKVKASELKPVPKANK